MAHVGVGAVVEQQRNHHRVGRLATHPFDRDVQRRAILRGCETLELAVGVLAPPLTWFGFGFGLGLGLGVASPNPTLTLPCAPLT